MEEQFFTEYRSQVMQFLRRHPDVLARYQVTQVSLAAQQILLQQAAAPKGVYLLASGLVKVTRTTAAGQFFTLGVFGPGETLGDVEALLHMPHFCTVQALTPCQLYCLPGAQFVALLAQEQEFNLLMHRSMASKMLNTSLQTSIQSTNRLFYTLMIVLRELSQLPELQVTKTLLCELVGTSSRNLNRLLRQLQQENLLTLTGPQVTHVHKPLLEKRIDTYAFEI